MKTLVLATTNRHKLREIGQMLNPLGIEVVCAADVCQTLPEVIEDGNTFCENAIKKATQIAKAVNMPALADDSGLEVMALGGAPGVHSARYAGEPCDDVKNLQKVLAEMVGKEDRRARFVCALAYATPEGLVGTTEGEIRGTLAREAHGNGGFGYDPAFIPEGYNDTFGVLPAELKNQLSHRHNALQQAIDNNLFGV